MFPSVSENNVTAPDLRGDFSISVWAQIGEHGADAAGNLVSQFDDRTRRGFNLGLTAGGGGYSAPGDGVRATFGVDNGSEPTWFDCGKPSEASDYVSNSLTVCGGALYAATSGGASPADRGRVYRHLGATAWEDQGQLSADADGVGPMISHRGLLFAATWNYDWTTVEQLDAPPCRVYRHLGPGRWEDCGQPGDSKRLYGFASYAGDLYVAGDDFTVHVYRGGQRWEKIGAFPTYVHPMTVRGGKLVMGTLDPASIWTFDGHTLEQCGAPYPTQDQCSQIHSFAGHRGETYLGSWPMGLVAKHRPDTGQWEDQGRPGDSTEINGLLSYNGKLYAGALPRAEVFRFEAAHDWTSIRRFNSPDGWEPAPVEASGWLPPSHARDGGDPSAMDDAAMREWARATSFAEFDGMLFVSTGNCTSAFGDRPTSAIGSVFSMRAGTVATARHALSPGLRHIAAVRQGGRLTLAVDGQVVASEAGPIVDGVQNSAPVMVGSGAKPERVVHAVRTFDHALSAGEIAALVQAGPTNSMRAPSDSGER